LPISFDVSFDFCHPVHSIVPTGQPSKSHIKVATVPEVAVAEDDHTLACKNDVRAAGQSIAVEPIAKSAMPKLSPQNQFAAGIRLRARTLSGPGGFLGCWEQSHERKSLLSGHLSNSLSIGSMQVGLAEGDL
jgi:hypothetical protein